MKPHTRAWALLIVSIFAAGSSYAVKPGPATAQSAPYPPVTIPNSEVRSLTSTSTGRHYDLLIRKPAGYDKDPGKKYPVL